MGIIGITGEKESGKDVAAEYLSRKLGHPIWKFATGVREVISVMTGLSVEFLESREGKKTILPEFGGITVGRALQVVGTDWGRNQVSENIWVNVLTRKWVDAGQPNIIISDVRFENEADFCHFVIKLERKNNTPNLSDGRDASHESETTVSKIKETVLIQSESVKDLFDQLDTLLSKY